jgi:hypothetical protein
MSTHDTEQKKRANAHFKREGRRADASQAPEDYRSAQQATSNQLRKLREERLAREAAQPKTKPSKATKKKS